MRYSEEVKNEVIRLILLGESITEVSNKMGISVSTIRTWMIKRRLIKAPRTPRNDDLNETLDMLRDGKTPYIISRKLNLRIEIIIEWKKEFEREGFL